MSAKDGDDEAQGPPDKWSHAPGGGVGALFRSARSLVGLDQTGLQDVQRRLAADAAEEPRLKRWLPALAIITILILGGGLTALARVGWIKLRAPSGVIEIPAAVPRPADSRGDKIAQPVPPVPPAPPETALAGPSTPLRPDAARTRRHTRGHLALGERVAQEPRTSPESSAVEEEARLLAVAIAALRARQPGRALEVLGEYQRKFAAGHLADEAAVLRVNATLALGRRREALAVLDRLSLATVPRSRELHILRAELRAETGRCAEAVADVRAAALGPAVGAALSARAAAVRTECESSATPAPAPAQ